MTAGGPAVERYDDPEPVNLGAGQEISIRDLAKMFADLTGFRGELRFDPSQPDGRPRRYLGTTRAREHFGFRASTLSVRGSNRRSASTKPSAAVEFSSSPPASTRESELGSLIAPSGALTLQLGRWKAT